MLVKGCVKVDASITETPLIPSSKPTFVMAEDREEDDRNQDDVDAEQKQQEWIKENDTGADYEARWLKKGNKSKYGYKKHYGVDVEGLVVGVHTTTANEHDSNGLEPLIKKVDPDFLEKGVYADKGYKVPKNDELLKSKGIKNRIQRKAYRNRPLTKWEKLFMI